MNKTLGDVKVFAFSSQEQPNALAQKANVAYKGLEKFQVYRQHLEALSEQLFSIFKDSYEKGLLTETLIKDLEKISQSLQSQQFRVADIEQISRQINSLAKFTESETGSDR